MNQVNHTGGRPLPPALTRSIISLLVPPLLAAIVTAVITNLTGVTGGFRGSLAIYFGVIGIVSWYLGGTWYGSKGMALRGGRPFYAGFGFAFLGWIVLLIARVAFVDTDQALYLQQPLLPTFFYHLLFEAFALQMWTFGLLFRSVADWRGGLTAAVASGLVFAVMGLNLFQESGLFTVGAVAYFTIWGVFYGLVRLRTGSIIGIILVQAMQSLTVWSLLPQPRPFTEANVAPLFFTLMGIWYAILIWRLWPKETEDYRV